MTDIGDMSRRKKRLQEKETTQNVDEGKTEDRRLSAGDVLGLGLNAPAGTPNLSTALAVSAAAAPVEFLLESTFPPYGPRGCP